MAFIYGTSGDDTFSSYNYREEDTIETLSGADVVYLDVSSRGTTRRVNTTDGEVIRNINYQQSTFTYSGTQVNSYGGAPNEHSILTGVRLVESYN